MICSSCRQEKELHAKGMCPHCYQKSRRIVDICVACGKREPIKARGICVKCYRRQYYRNDGPRKKKEIIPTDHAKSVWATIRKGPITLASLGKKFKMTPSELLSVLASLENTGNMTYQDGDTIGVFDGPGNLDYEKLA